MNLHPATAVVGEAKTVRAQYSAAVDDHLVTDRHPMVDGHIGGDPAAGTDAGPGTDAGTRADPGAWPDHHFGSYDRQWAHRGGGMDLGRGIDHGAVVNARGLVRTVVEQRRRPGIGDIGVRRDQCCTGEIPGVVGAEDHRRSRGPGKLLAIGLVGQKGEVSALGVPEGVQPEDAQLGITAQFGADMTRDLSEGPSAPAHWVLALSRSSSLPVRSSAGAAKITASRCNSRVTPSASTSSLRAA